MEQKIVLSSEAVKTDNNTPSNFTVRFEHPLILDKKQIVRCRFG